MTQTCTCTFLSKEDGGCLLRERKEHIGCKYRITSEGCPDMCGMVKE